jgi:nucleotide-binding universal stress UspA family protein
MYKKILVPTDGSGPAERAIHQAGELGKLAGAEVTIFQVIETPFDRPPTEEKVEETAAYLKEAKRKLKADGVADVKTKYTYGPVGDQLKRELEEGEYDMVVIGYTGRSKVHELIMGSTTEKAIKYSKGNLIVVVK